MWTWFVSGGWVMWLLVVVGALSVSAAFKFARVPDAEQLPRIASISRAVAWTTLVGVAADLAAVGLHIDAHPEWLERTPLAQLVLLGVAESLTPAMLGGSVLVVTHLLLAAGHGRLSRVGTTP